MTTTNQDRLRWNRILRWAEAARDGEVPYAEAIEAIKTIMAQIAAEQPTNRIS